MDKVAAVVLEKKLEENLKKLKSRSKTENKKLTQKKSPNGISVIEAFDVDLELEVSEVLMLNLRFLKTFADRKPNTIKEFVRFAGGVSASIDKLINFRTPTSNLSPKTLLQDQNDEVIEYIDVIEQMLVKAKGLTPQRPSSDNTQTKHTTLALPFCALCYKRVNQSPYYCRDHHSSRNALAYKKTTRRLVSAVYRYSNDKSEKRNLNDYKRGDLTLTAELLYRWLALFSVQPRMAIGSLNQVDKTKPDWTGYAKVILEFSKSHYPKAYEMIKGLEINRASYEDWIVEIARSLGGEIEGNLWRLKDSDIWLEASSNMQKSMTLLNCISRYEAFMIVCSFPIETGVIKGTNMDIEKRDRLKALLEERKVNPNITMNEIAKTLGISRTAVYKLKNKIC
ncbi:helix-turn-helix domain-containing protein [Vibrio owensii]|uniref:helix-turn-helix domain-containing protein n=1 Tax=Vibrio owensii TaxID=696485 RepID=UPI003D9FD129